MNAGQHRMPAKALGEAKGVLVRANSCRMLWRY